METDGDLRLTRIRGRIKAWLSQTDAGVRHQVLREWIDGDNFLDGIILLQRELLLPIGFKKNLPMPYLESRGLSEEDVRLAEANVERILRPLLDETAQELRTAGRLSGDDPNESTVKRRGAKDDSQETQRTYVQTGRPDLTAKALGPAALAPAATAIIAWHGMGQQLPFETVETVARALAKDQARQTGGSEPIVTTRLVQLGTQQLWRAELDVTAAGSAHHVHIYEAYWAPLTQGKISTGETVKFLLGAAYHGIRYCAARPPLFLRYLFGRWVKFRLKPSLALVFVGLVVTLLSLVAMNFAITTAVSVKLLTGGGGPGGWPSHSLLADLTIDFGWLELVLGSLLLAFTKAYWSQKKYRREARSSKRHGVIRWLMWALIGLAVAVTLVVALLVAAHLVIHRTPVRMWWPILTGYKTSFGRHAVRVATG